ncbi:MAG: T9SS type A sorting domain-containing protein [Bacteroidetes bacterium]|nr:T9SS type A sorting domain-containing protein [Bacteroidota bacterium]MCL5027986.1 T9SS type A sorting domain-containing protein [Bacteroidota bacterium]
MKTLHLMTMSFLMVSNVLVAQSTNLTFHEVFSFPNHYVIKLLVAPSQEILAVTSEQYSNASLLFYSTNAGNTWLQPASLPPCGIGSIAVTKQGYWFISGPFWGLFQSKDKGTTWESNIDLSDVGDIFPKDSTDVLVSVIGKGIYSSRGSGVSWYESDKGIRPDWDSTGQWLGGTGIGTFTKSAEGYLFAGSGEYYGGGSGVARSKDRGQTWHYTNKGLLDTTVAYLATSSNGRVIASSVGRHSQDPLFEVSDSIPHLFISTNSGDSWCALFHGADYQKFSGYNPVALFKNIIFSTYYNGKIYFMSDTGKARQSLGLKGSFAIDSSGFVYIGTLGSLLKSDQSLNVLSSISLPTVSLPIHSFLYQNYPNPFNPTTLIKYSLAQTSLVNLSIYDVLGRKVATLVDKEQSLGNYEVEFDGSNLASGVYFYRIQAGSFIQTKKFMLIK